MNTRFAVLLDFDGTLTERDVGEVLLDAFASHNWRREAVQWHAGRITFKEMNEREFAHLPADRRTEMERHAAEHTKLRAGALELVALCNERGIPLEIVSGGLDFYIRAVLLRHGLNDLSILCLKQADFSTGGAWVVARYPRGVQVCEAVGACKCSRLWHYQGRGYRVLYVGDGNSDRCIAAKADLLYARSSLARYCLTEGIPFTPFDTLHDVVGELERLLV